MKLSVSAYRAHASAHKKILSSGYHSQLNYGSTGAGTTASSSSTIGLYAIETNETSLTFPQQEMNKTECNNSDTDVISPTGTSSSGQDQNQHPAAAKRRPQQRKDDDQISNAHSSHSDSKSPSQRSPPSSSSTTCSHSVTNNIFATISGGNNLMESQPETRTTRIKNYTERDRLTLSNHSSLDYNRPHVKLLFNSPSSEILGSIVYSATSNSLNSNHQTKLATPALVRQQILQSDGGDVDAEADADADIGDEKPTGSAPKNGTNQKWKNVKAVMAYYCTLRRIKRNGPFSIISSKSYDSIKTCCLNI